MGQILQFIFPNYPALRVEAIRHFRKERESGTEMRPLLGTRWSGYRDFKIQRLKNV